MTAPIANPTRPHFPRRGILFGLLAAFCISSQDAVIKLLSDDYHIVQIIFFRSFIGLLIATTFILIRRDTTALRPSRPWLTAMRVFFMFIASLCYYISLTKLDLSVYSCLGLSVFIFASAMSGPLLHEKTAARDWCAVAAGLCGMIIIINPIANDNIHIPAALLLLFGALMWALGLVTTRALSVSISAVSLMFYASLALTAVSAVALPFFWRPPALSDSLLLLLLGLLGACGQGCGIAAYRVARMSTVIPTQHTMALWGAFFAWLLLDESPTYRLWLGGALIIGASLATLPKPRRRRTNPNGQK